ncbi:hypothetical protein [uncultured Pseudokineococcus sp.]|uniref:hypothetical protein n=1 Tax=uncultured Pseudokineococcus sp. TaxID=1642928 RepID=UPI00260DC7DD|nr:hypothetical protein [uncultured Pseudokineococcus sp.]
MPITEEVGAGLPGTPAVDADGAPLGPVTGVFDDDHTGRPEWAVVRVAGLERLAPLADADVRDGRLHLAVTADRLLSAPAAEEVEHVSHADSVALYQHYGTSPAGDTDVTPAG